MVALFAIKLLTVPFFKKIESLQCNATLAITGVIRERSRAKILEELGLEPLQQRRI